jgi:hypothetical protein
MFENKEFYELLATIGWVSIVVALIGGVVMAFLFVMYRHFKSRPSKALALVLEQYGGGVHKRVDENRELLELLREKAPELLNDCPWIVGWIQSHDQFFAALMAVPEMKDLQPRFGTRPGFPRPFPQSD